MNAGRTNRWLIGAGIALPILLFAGLVAYRWAAHLGVEPPAYDLLFMVSVYNPDVDTGLETRLDIEQGRLVVRARAARSAESYRNRSVLFRFHHETQRIRQVVFPLPDADAVPESGWSAGLEVLSEMRLSPRTEALDGWTFDPPRHGGPGVFGLLFGGHRSGDMRLTQGGATLVLSFDSDLVPVGPPRFLGWVLSEDGS